ncbi:MAG: hypothetical protein D6719_06870 [Candidatus Dadabacteria bacterium]|nr:MAG: hypothetical protein D6719_06870 [Candidatus Dadabacteria bacterium]
MKTMKNSKLLQSRKNNISDTQRWLVTFGDLLTLLLVFFLSIISFGNFGSPRITSNNYASAHKNFKNPVRKEFLQRPGQTGITIAHLTDRDSPDGEVRIVFKETDFESQSGVLLKKARKHLKKKVVTAAYLTEQAVVEACRANNGERDAAAWFVSAGRLLDLRSQLVDAGVDARRIYLRAVGRDCQTLSESRSDTDGLVAVIRLGIRERKDA